MLNNSKQIRRSCSCWLFCGVLIVWPIISHADDLESKIFDATIAVEKTLDSDDVRNYFREQTQSRYFPQGLQPTYKIEADGVIDQEEAKAFHQVRLIAEWDRDDDGKMNESAFDACPDFSLPDTKTGEPRVYRNYIAYTMHREIIEKYDVMPAHWMLRQSTPLERKLTQTENRILNQTVYSLKSTDMRMVPLFDEILKKYSYGAGSTFFSPHRSDTTRELERVQKLFPLQSDDRMGYVFANTFRETTLSQRKEMVDALIEAVQTISRERDPDTGIIWGGLPFEREDSEEFYQEYVGEALREAIRMLDDGKSIDEASSHFVRKMFSEDTPPEFAYNQIGVIDPQLQERSELPPPNKVWEAYREHNFGKRILEAQKPIIYRYGQHGQIYISGIEDESMLFTTAEVSPKSLRSETSKFITREILKDSPPAYSLIFSYIVYFTRPNETVYESLASFAEQAPPFDQLYAEISSNLAEQRVLDALAAVRLSDLEYNIARVELARQIRKADQKNVRGQRQLMRPDLFATQTAAGESHQYIHALSNHTTHGRQSHEFPTGDASAAVFVSDTAKRYQQLLVLLDNPVAAENSAQQKFLKFYDTQDEAYILFRIDPRYRRNAGERVALAKISDELMKFHQLDMKQRRKIARDPTASWEQFPSLMVIGAQYGQNNLLEIAQKF